MPKNNVSDPITDKEIAFAHLVLSGTMTDRRAAEAVGLNPDTAAYTKAKPRVRAYMLEHRAAVNERLVQQETEELRRLQPESRPSPGPPLANRRPGPRNDPQQRFRSGQGPLHDRRHRRPDPRTNDRRAVSAAERTRPAARKPAILCLRMDADPAKTCSPAAPLQEEASPEPQSAPGRRMTRQSYPAPSRIVIVPTGSGGTCPAK